MATDHFGEIALLADLAPPEVACVTRVAPAHLDAFGDVEAVAREKGDLVAALGAEGLAVLNAEDPRVAAMAGRSAAPVLRCAAEPGTPAELRASELRLTRDGTRMLVHLPGGETVQVRLPWLGAHFAISVLFAFAVGERFGLSPGAVAERLATTPAVAGRLNPPHRP